MAMINPIRYRSYYYDMDLEMYYLQSRYYDPNTCRFINADAVMADELSLQGNNLYVYCFNNPVNMIDVSGNWPEWATVALGIVAAVVAVAATVVTCGAAAPAAATIYAADVAYSSVTGESPLLNTFFNGNYKAYEARFFVTSMAMTGMLQAATYSPGTCFVAGTLVKTEKGREH